MSDPLKLCTFTPLSNDERDPGKAASICIEPPCEVDPVAVADTATIVFVNGEPVVVLN